MNIKMVKFEEINYGWDIHFNAELTQEEVTKCDMNHLIHVGDYEIELKKNIISFQCYFDRGELRGNETIDERLKLIKNDIENLAESCIN